MLPSPLQLWYHAIVHCYYADSQQHKNDPPEHKNGKDEAKIEPQHTNNDTLPHEKVQSEDTTNGVERGSYLYM